MKTNSAGSVLALVDLEADWSHVLENSINHCNSQNMDLIVTWVAASLADKDPEFRKVSGFHDHHRLSPYMNRDDLLAAENRLLGDLETISVPVMTMAYESYVSNEPLSLAMRDRISLLSVGKNVKYQSIISALVEDTMSSSRIDMEIPMLIVLEVGGQIAHAKAS